MGISFGSAQFAMIGTENVAFFGLKGLATCFHRAELGYSRTLSKTIKSTQCGQGGGRHYRSSRPVPQRVLQQLAGQYRASPTFYRLQIASMQTPTRPAVTGLGQYLGLEQKPSRRQLAAPRGATIPCALIKSRSGSLAGSPCASGTKGRLVRSIFEHCL